jgi:tripartite-type tricarboxylate transporter receptor subunit TctC
MGPPFPAEALMPLSLFRCRRRAGAACLLLLATACGAAHGQSYPARSVRMVVPFPAGGGTDFIGRTVGARLSELWGQPVVMDNRPGATTVLGAEIVARSPPDGYTLLVTPVPFSIVPNLQARLPFDPLKDFEPIALYNIAPLVLIVNPIVPVKTVQDLIALARSKPGVLNFGTSGTGSSNHLAGELFNAMAGVRITHVPYKGSPPALVDLVGGHVDLAVTTLTSAVGLIKSGKVRPVAVTSLKRSSAMPEIPTMDESGLKGFQADAWNGISAPARTPREIVTRINADVARVLQMPDVIEKFRNEGAEPAAMAPEQFAAFVRSEIAKWGKVIRLANIRPE